VPGSYSVLAICGSLRAASYNGGLVRAATALAPPGMTVEIYGDLATIPPYNADLDTIAPPAPVAALRERINAVDGLLLATPEFNYSIPGVLKNALDWASRVAVGVPALRHKPIAIMGASPGNFGSVRAQLALRQMFLWTDSRVVVKPEVIVFRAHERFDDTGNLSDDATRALIEDLLASLARLIDLHRTVGDAP
jgi:chromate reductase